MLTQKDLENIKEITEEFFKKTTFEVEIEFLPQKELTLPINIKSEEPQILIGEGGQTLAEIQHLLTIMLKRKIKPPSRETSPKDNKLPTGQALRGGESFYINLDINNYKKKKIEYLKELASSLADEVSLTKREKILSSMPAYERRIIHLELAERKDVTTESVGQEPARKVVIRPYP